MMEDDFEAQIDRLIVSSTKWFSGNKSRRELLEIDVLLDEKIKLFKKLREKIRHVIAADEIRQEHADKISQIKTSNENLNLAEIAENEERIEKLIAAVNRYKQKNIVLETENEKLKSDLNIKA